MFQVSCLDQTKPPLALLPPPTNTPLPSSLPLAPTSAPTSLAVIGHDQLLSLLSSLLVVFLPSDAPSQQHLTYRLLIRTEAPQKSSLWSAPKLHLLPEGSHLLPLLPLPSDWFLNGPLIPAYLSPELQKHDRYLSGHFCITSSEPLKLSISECEYSMFAPNLPPPIPRDGNTIHADINQKQGMMLSLRFMLILRAPYWRCPSHCSRSTKRLFTLNQLTQIQRTKCSCSEVGGWYGEEGGHCHETPPSEPKVPMPRH